MKNTWTDLVQVFFCCLNSLGVWKGRKEKLCEMMELSILWYFKGSGVD